MKCMVMTSFHKGVNVVTVPSVCVDTGMRQQSDRGTQYRSAVYESSPTKHEVVLKSKVAYQQVGRPGARRCLKEHKVAFKQGEAAALVQK